MAAAAFERRVLRRAAEHHYLRVRLELPDGGARPNAAQFKQLVVTALRELHGEVGPAPAPAPGLRSAPGWARRTLRERAAVPWHSPGCGAVSEQAGRGGWAGVGPPVPGCPLASRPPGSLPVKLCGSVRCPQPSGFSQP
uniref:Ribonuclease P/MRP subunit p14 n=1 Tax=Serinus canaria TaxID=9135 RepID=A0A8C9MTB8_SERCA